MEYNGKTLHNEDLSVSKPFRQEYLASIKRLTDKLTAEGAENRTKYMPPEKYAADREKYRNDYINMLGFPLTQYDKYAHAPMNVRKTFVARDDLREIYRMQFEIFEDFWFYGVLQIPLNLDGKAPFVISQHGGGGTPENSSDFLGVNNYNHMSVRMLERGAVVFSPQILLWNCSDDPAGPIPGCGDKYDRGLTDRVLKQFGGSIQALEVFCIKRVIDYFEDNSDIIDSSRIGMIGLSYGSFYTLYTAAADERIVSAYASCCFNDRIKYCWSDMSWFNAGNTFLDAEVAALVAPRRLYLEVGRNDPLFTWETASEEAKRVPEYFKACNAEDNFRFSVWEGGHSVDSTDTGIDFMFEKLKG